MILSRAVFSPVANRTTSPIGVGEVAQRKVRGADSTRASAAAVTCFSAAMLALLVGGWILRDVIPLTPEAGVGYGLGVAGGSAMLLLTLYPLRKNLRFMRGWGKLRHWFSAHMMLGILGPVLILLHCNFQVGAPNSHVALISMLVVAGSGIVGRFIYTRISHGLYGARATIEELRNRLDADTHALSEWLPPSSRAARRLFGLASQAHESRRCFAVRLLRRIFLPLVAVWVRGRVLLDIHADLTQQAADSGWDPVTRRARERAVREVVRRYVAALVKEAQFDTYARLFSLWHALHLPLFLMLLLTGILHVVAVHMY